MGLTAKGVAGLRTGQLVSMAFGHKAKEEIVKRYLLLLRTQSFSS